VKIRLAIVAALALLVGAAPAPLKELLTLSGRIPLPGVRGRIDHLAIDSGRDRLYVAALGNGSVEVCDLKARSRASSLKGFKEPQGLLLLPGGERLFVSSGGSGAVEILDAGTGKRAASVALGEDADNIRLDGQAGRVYVGYGDGALGVIEAASGRRVGSIPLPGHPESFMLESSGPRIFVNVPDARRIAVVDRIRGEVIAEWPLAAARGNFPMALDEANHRLFVGCREPASLLVYDTRTGKLVTEVGIPGDVDDIFYDRSRRRLYLSCGAGFLAVLRQVDADRYEDAGRIPTAAGARTCLFVPEKDRLYLAVPQRGGEEAEIRIYEPAP
jgi:DNA-binding beta-propeller fold protein YncE